MDPNFVRVLTMCGWALLAAVGVFIARHFISNETLHENHEFTGFTYAILGAIYGVYLAFTVVVVWEQFAQADDDAVSEAVHLSEAWRDTTVLPKEARRVLHEHMKAYADAVIEREWPSMAAGHGADAEAAAKYEEVWQAMYAAKADARTPGDNAFFQEAVAQMNDVGMERRMRLMSSTSQLPPVMWMLLIGGGAITILFTYMIGTENVWIRILATASMAALIVFTLLLIAALQHPFGGDVSVKPDGFEGVTKSFVNRLQTER